MLKYVVSYVVTVCSVLAWYRMFLCALGYDIKKLVVEGEAVAAISAKNTSPQSSHAARSPTMRATHEDERSFWRQRTTTAENTVAAADAPCMSTASVILPWRTKYLSVVSTSVNSPFPLNVYPCPSKVTM